MGQQRQPSLVTPGFMTSPQHGRAFAEGKWVEGWVQSAPISPTVANLYVCPAGRKALVSQVVFVNTTGVSINVSCYAVPFGSSATAQNRFISGGVGANGQINYNTGILLKAGDSLGCNATATLVNAYASVWEFDAAEGNIDGFYYALAFNTLTQLYTAPTGRSAHIVMALGQGGYTGIIYNDVQSPNAQFRNYFQHGLGGTLQIGQIDLIPTSNTKTLDVVMWPTLGAGDSWWAWTNASQASTTSGGMNIWGVVCEFDA